jgi:hypothetical protein
LGGADHGPNHCNHFSSRPDHSPDAEE